MDVKEAQALIKVCKDVDDWSAAWADLAKYAGTFGEGWDDEPGARMVVAEMVKGLGSTRAKVRRGVENLAGYVPPRHSGEDSTEMREPEQQAESAEAGDDAPDGGEQNTGDGEGSQDTEGEETSGTGESGNGEGADGSESGDEQGESSEGAGEPSDSDGASDSSEGAEGEESDSESSGDEQDEDDILSDLFGDDEDGDGESDSETDPEQADAENNHGQGESDDAEGDADTEAKEQQGEGESEGESSEGGENAPVLAFTGPKDSLNELLDLASAWPDVRPLTPEDWAKILGGEADALPETIPGPVDESGAPVRDLIADISACWSGDPSDVLVPYLWGPPGAGKTYSMRAAAERLGLKSAEVEMGRMTTELDVKGFINGYGVVRTTPREIVEHGGVLIVNEGDNANADVWIALNGLVEAVPGVSQYVFPDGPVTVHRDFRIGITGNTNGRGGTIGFESREALDLSSLDRMTYFKVGYDRKHDEQLCGTASYLVDALWMLREAGEKLRLDHVFTPRSIIKARKALKKQRWTWEQILDQCFLTHCGEDDVAALRRSAPKVWSLAK